MLEDTFLIEQDNDLLIYAGNQYSGSIATWNILHGSFCLCETLARLLCSTKSTDRKLKRMKIGTIDLVSMDSDCSTNGKLPSNDLQIGL